MTRDHLLGWTHAAQFIADNMPDPVRSCPVRLVRAPLSGAVAELARWMDTDPAKRAQQAVPEPAAAPAAALGDGWIEWGGGECPIPKARQGEYQIRFRNGIFGRSESMMARDWSWRDSSSDYSIVAYRLLPKGGAA
jgi:hypothetical protein